MFKIDVNVLLVTQISLSVILIVLILMQQRGSGLSSAFGAVSGMFSYRGRRGFERLIFLLTVLFSVFLFLVSLLIVAAYP